MTSIEWLEEQLNPDMKTMQGNIIQGLLEQAKEMHKAETERMYSEEEVLELLLKSKIETSNLYYEDIKEWFNKLKKD